MTEKPIIKSKRFVSAVVGLLVMLLVALVPELEGVEAPITDYLTDVVLALIAGYSITDIAHDWLARRAPAEESMSE